MLPSPGDWIQRQDFPITDSISNSNITKFPGVLACCWINFGWVVDVFQITLTA